MKSVKSFVATIYVGFREHYTDEVRAIDMAHDICQRYVDAGGLCVTVTATRFIYKNGSEPGVAVGLINYPRFPAEVSAIRDKALGLATELMHGFRQLKVSVVFPDETIMLETYSA